ncbi:MAG: hypothetical protein KBS73_00990 [Bacteroidales bacterium]|nr:hypothetical protein [Candidatus Cacconaster equifaecalis]
MRKILFILLASTFVFSNLSAQMRFGGNININSSKQTGVYDQYGKRRIRNLSRWS